MAGYLEPKLLPMGDTAWTIELGDAIDIDGHKGAPSVI